MVLCWTWNNCFLGSTDKKSLICEERQRSTTDYYIYLLRALTSIKSYLLYKGVLSAVSHQGASGNTVPLLLWPCTWDTAGQEQITAPSLMQTAKQNPGSIWKNRTKIIIVPGHGYEMDWEKIFGFSKRVFQPGWVRTEYRALKRHLLNPEFTRFHYMEV